jgi:hypothetical protein
MAGVQGPRAGGLPGAEPSDGVEFSVTEVHGLAGFLPEFRFWQEAEPHNRVKRCFHATLPLLDIKTAV